MVPMQRVAHLAVVAALVATMSLSLAPEAPAASVARVAVFNLEEATIADIQAAFAAGALTCRQLTQLYLNRIAAYDDNGPTLNSIITVNPRALETATALDAERAARGPRSHSTAFRSC